MPLILLLYPVFKGIEKKNQLHKVSSEAFFAFNVLPFASLQVLCIAFGIEF